MFSTGSPTTAPSEDDEDVIYVAPAENIFAGRLYASAQWVHTLISRQKYY